jgi:putative nucleotidyltransferase with HDIG domain
MRLGGRPLAAASAGHNVGNMGTTAISTRINVARTVAGMLLRDLPERWAHSAGVAAEAARVAVTIDPADRELLVVAAWLHDIGYSPELHYTGFHPLDGATYLWQHGWPKRICGLVAHHSGAVFVARAHGLDTALDRYPCEQSPIADALTYADQTVGPGGQPMTLDERMAEMLARRGPDSPQARAHPQREPYLRAAAARVEHRLSTYRPWSAATSDAV